MANLVGEKRHCGWWCDGTGKVGGCWSPLPGLGDGWRWLFGRRGGEGRCISQCSGWIEIKSSAPKIGVASLRSQ